MASEASFPGKDLCPCSTKYESSADDGRRRRVRRNCGLITIEDIVEEIVGEIIGKPTSAKRASRSFPRTMDRGGVVSVRRRHPSDGPSRSETTKPSRAG
ncbi:MAG: hypothetical protein ACLT98_12900 [Eggerthellaceae bacterium]